MPSTHLRPVSVNQPECIATIPYYPSNPPVLAPEVLAGRCPRPCNECTRAQIQKVMTELSQKFPREFQEMINKGRRPG